MDKEKELKQKYGKNNPFKVPEGYFDHLTQHIMEQIPATQVQETAEISLWGKIKPWVYMAAMFVGMSFTIRMFMGKFGMEKDTDYNNIPSCNVSELPDELVDPIVNQTMMDDYQLYEYLTDATNHK